MNDRTMLNELVPKLFDKEYKEIIELSKIAAKKGHKKLFYSCTIHNDTLKLIKENNLGYEGEWKFGEFYLTFISW